MKSIIIIPSRMASTRFPGKPLVKIAGIPMVQRVWQQAIASNVGDVYVACAEKVVYDLINEIGGKAIITDPQLASGTDRTFAALQQIQNISDVNCIINLQGDMPLIDPDHINKVIEPLKNDYSIGTLATNIKKSELNNPNVTKVQVKWNESNVGEAKDFFRQKELNSDNIFHHVGIYSYSPEALRNFVNLPTSKNEKNLNLEQFRAIDEGIKIGVVQVYGIPPSVDTKEDLITVENIIREKYEKN